MTWRLGIVREIQARADTEDKSLSPSGSDGDDLQRRSSHAQLKADKGGRPAEP